MRRHDSPAVPHFPNPRAGACVFRACASLTHADRRSLASLASTVLASLLAVTPCVAQTTTAPAEHVIPSSVLQEPRTVRVVLPPHYAISARRYPVLYVLDGDSNLTHAAKP